MCLAMPGQIVQMTPASGGGRAVVDMNGNRFGVNLVMTPEARVGDWVLVHAGFAIKTVGEQDARATWALLNESGAAQ